MAGSHFATTHWSLILAARDRAEPGSADALASLCALYWYPLYAYVRRRGNSAEYALDLTQGFFARLLEKDFLAAVDQGKGKFRSYLLAACNHFLANEYDRAVAVKRGGGKPVLSLDAAAAEGRYLAEAADELTPERLFERRWALALLQHVMTRLRADFEAKHKGRLFERLRGFLVGEKGAGYRQAAAEVGMSEAAIKVHVHRLRARYRELLREEIGRTVGTPEEIDDEIRSLFAALA
jgi:DNA-directed RNA polymerase specialized sigma24 family protein